MREASRILLELAAKISARERSRDFWRTPVALLVMMIDGDRRRVSVDRAAAGLGVLRSTVIQGIHRLRVDGFDIQTIPRRRDGPYRCWGYELAEADVVKADDYVGRGAGAAFRRSP